MAERAIGWRFIALELAVFALLTPWPLTLVSTGIVFIFGLAFNDTARPLGGLYEQVWHVFGFTFGVGAGIGLLAGIAYAALRHRGEGFVVRLIASLTVAVVGTVAAAAIVFGWHPDAWWLAALAGQCEASGAAAAALIVGVIETRRLKAPR